INESVREIMTHDVIYINENDSVGNTLEKMYKEDVGGFPILNKNKIVVGIVEEEDFIYNLAGIWSGYSINDIMSKEVITITPGFTIGDTCRLMIKNYRRRIPIVSDDELVGIVTTFDIIKYFASSKMLEKMRSEDVEDALGARVTEVMTTDVKTINPLDDVGKAIELMEKCKIGLLPVVEDGRLIGVITERDILMKMMQEGNV
ncbi:MAG TPA: CBS domain-containing protein, partial [Candidatus Methanofastidiosa archaeon]|nr:CBS domain-containing protein [Candidatus Methanofastidiosa archaeon]